MCCGDYHYAFQDSLKDQLILNPGCLMRKSLTDVKLGHQPSVCVVDIETLEVTTKVLDVENAELIFDLSKPEAKRDSQALNDLLEQLKHVGSGEQKGLSWDGILNRVIREKGVSKQAQEIIDSITEEMSNV